MQACTEISTNNSKVSSCEVWGGGGGRGVVSVMHETFVSWNRWWGTRKWSRYAANLGSLQHNLNPCAQIQIA